MYSILRMIDDHMVYHQGLYTTEQQDAWNNLKQMSGDMNVFHSRLFLTNLRAFIE